MSNCNRGLFITRQAIRRQLAAMPCDAYLVRVIDHLARRPAAVERWWTAGDLTNLAAVSFFRARNGQGCDIYIYPFAGDHNSGYILVDLDRAEPGVLDATRANGHEPCVVLQTSPGNLQAWVHVSAAPLPPALATAVGKQLARIYRADLASTDWRHLGRLAGFTNRKHKTAGGYAPWVRVLQTRAGLATQAAALLAAVEHQLALAARPPAIAPPRQGRAAAGGPLDPHAGHIYQTWLHRLRIPQRYPHTDWSIADKWIAKALLGRGRPAAEVEAILRGGSPGFPRRHADPQDYLRRTLARAASELSRAPFPARGSHPRLDACLPSGWPPDAA